MKNTVGCLQATYLPWIPFFKRFLGCDYFVLLDDVDYSKNSNQNRNYIKINNLKRFNVYFKSTLSLGANDSFNLKKFFFLVFIVCSLKEKIIHIITVVSFFHL